MLSTSLDLRRAETGGIDYLERARELAPMLAAASDEIEERRELPERVVEALIEGGFFRMLLPRSLGGAELDPLSYVQVLEEIAKADPSDRLVPRAEFGLLDDRPLSRPGGGARDLRAAARHPRLGAGAAGCGARGGRRGRHPRHRALGLCHRQPARHLARRARPDLRAGRHAAPQPERPPVRPHRAVSEVERRDHRQLAGHRAARHRQRQLSGRGPFRAAEIHRLARQRGRAARAGPALPLHQRHDLCGELLERVARRSPAARSTPSSCWRATRSRAAPAAPCARTTWSSRRSRNARRGCAPRAPSSTRPWPRCGRTAERKGEFLYDQHVRLRLSTTWAIHQARDVVATVYGAAGSNAVFNENPFERRLRDIHAGTQQGQGRPIHFETVGQVLLGLPPQGRMFR